jgi:O-antigen/teichoic acid export membrane protein
MRQRVEQKAATAPTMQHKGMLSGHRLAWNSLLNAATALFVVGLNIAFVPLILHRFGTELYGVLTVTWMVLGNFNWLDFGFSRASARYVAQELALGQPDRAVLWTLTAVLSQVLLGTVGSVVVWHLAPLIVAHLHVQPANHAIVITALRVFAFSIPLDFAMRSLTGVMQAAQRFDWVNALSLLGTLGTYGVYTLAILEGGRFTTVIYGLLLVRLLNVVSAYIGAAHVLPSLSSVFAPRTLLALTSTYWTNVVTLVRFGTWVAAAAVLGPLLLLFDQWMIGILIGIAMLPFYTIPTNLLVRLGLFPTALTTTLFPAFSALEAKRDWSRIGQMFVRAHRYLIVILMPVIFLVAVWAREIFRLWIGPDFAVRATEPLRILAVGFLIALLAPLSGAILEAAGRPDILVKVYLLELPVNVGSVWFLTKHYGIVGAAVSYSLRSILETIILWGIVHHLLPLSRRALAMSLVVRPAPAMLCLGAASWLLRNASIRSPLDIAATGLLLAAYGIYAARWILNADDRRFGATLYTSKRAAIAARLGVGRTVLAE